MKTRICNLLIWIAASFALVLADQYTKFLAVAHLKDQPPIVLLENVFELYYSENRGAAFGMLQGRQGFFLAITIVVLAVAAYAMSRMPSWKCKRYHFLKLCIIMITAGAVGNMIDRVSQGYVVDFLYFKLINFPIFNVADIYVTVATAFLLILFTFYYKDDELDIFQWNKKREDYGKGQHFDT